MIANIFGFNFFANVAVLLDVCLAGIHIVRYLLDESQKTLNVDIQDDKLPKLDRLESFATEDLGPVVSLVPEPVIDPPLRVIVNFDERVTAVVDKVM